MPVELFIQTRTGERRKIALAGDRLQVGRAADNDLCFPDDPSLSRKHLVFVRTPGGWTVEDLGAKNRTTVNGTRIDGPVLLASGDRIVAGQLVMTVDRPGDDMPSDVIVVGGPDAEPLRPTLMTNLEGILGRETTMQRGVTASGITRRPTRESRAIVALVRAGQELAGQRPLPELFQLILDLSLEAVRADRGVLMTLEGEDLAVRAVKGEGFRISTAVRDKVIKERASILVRDMRIDDALARRDSIIAQNIHTMMAVPLQTHDRVIGLIDVDSRSFTHEFGEDDLELLTVLANVAAIRIEQARLAQVEALERIRTRELEQAAEIQRRLLPAAAPEVPGWDLAGHNAACRTVGGDYYDFFRYPDGRIAMALGDVSGKGMPAALLMTCLQSSVQVLAQEPDHLERLMSRLDRVMATNCPANRFVSFFFCVVDPTSGSMVYCNAGHNPPIVVRRDGTVEHLRGGGTMLGILPDLGYVERRAELRPGDVLAIFSDGITEAANDQGEEFGDDRLAAILHRYRDEPSTTILRHVDEAVSAFTGGAPAADDITLVVTRRLVG